MIKIYFIFDPVKKRETEILQGAIYHILWLD